MISVVIPAFNEEKYIGLCLSGFIHQTTTEPFEVLVVNNCSTDATASVAASFSPRLNVRVLSEEKKGRGAAREKGFREALGSVIFSTDADAVVTDDWIASHLAVYDKNPKVVAVTGACKLGDCPLWVAFLANALFPLYVRTWQLLLGWTCLNGFNFSVKADAYRACGGFNRESDSNEDLELSIKLKKTGTIALASASPFLSGRRFKHGFFRTVLQYVWAFVQKFVFRRERVALKDL
jgi:glycosyltransferase involved in cell wall biosynthesis